MTGKTMHQRGTDDFQRLLAGTHDDPFSVLGLHEVEGGHLLVVILPGAERVSATQGKTKTEIAAVADAPGIFAGPSPTPTVSGPFWEIWTNT
jgi:1,4-alpha-glucan branching enzyme